MVRLSRQSSPGCRSPAPLPFVFLRKGGRADQKVVIAYDCGLMSICVRVLEVRGQVFMAILPAPEKRCNGKRGTKLIDDPKRFYSNKKQNINRYTC